MVFCWINLSLEKVCCFVFFVRCLGGKLYQSSQPLVFPQDQNQPTSIQAAHFLLFPLLFFPFNIMLVF
ncbi:hypothetical protein BD408DRAFT_56670 [Parasitella parasitica]|nr:hypothetical protein BD408DRAFT_56670 [Parasitella parasitica]